MNNIKMEFKADWFCTSISASKYWTWYVYGTSCKENLYGQEQASREFDLYSKEGLTKIGSTPSKVDECLFYQDKTIFIYVDEGIVVNKNMDNVNKVIHELKEQGYDIK